MGRKLVSMSTEARAEQARVTASGREVRGISNDIDCVADRLFRGKTAKAKLRNGVEVSGKIFAVNNAGFRGIEVHLYVGKGANRVHRVVSMDECRVWMTV